MVADSADKLWTAAIDSNGDSRAGLLEDRVANLELEQGRLTEQLSSLQVSGQAHRPTAAAPVIRPTPPPGTSDFDPFTQGIGDRSMIVKTQKLNEVAL
jgi:hypothetical protein